MSLYRLSENKDNAHLAWEENVVHENMNVWNVLHHCFGAPVHL
jgi:hypothetical protein